MPNRILIVDDDVNVVLSLRRVLHKELFEVLTATSPPEALDILRRHAVDVIVSDEQMPEMSGVTFLTRVKESYPDTIRFILTGQATLDLAIDAINQGGVSRFFVKPCNVHDLRVSIRQELQKRDLMVAARRLLNKVKQQNELLRDLENEFPSISTVERDDEGAIWIDESPGDYGELMNEIDLHLKVPTAMAEPDVSNKQFSGKGPSVD